MYFLAIGIITIATICLPALLPIFQPWMGKTQLRHSAPAWLPSAAAICLIAAFFLPDIHISRQTTTFQEHFVGGGLYCACLFVYLQNRLGLNPRLLPGLIEMFAFTATLGVANELFELVLKELHLLQINISDTNWDLAANTLGGFIGYILLQPFSHKRSS